MTIFLIISGFVLSLAGLVGCIFPFIPGPPLSFLALIILSFAKDWEPFSPTFLIVTGGLTLLVLFLDYMASVIGARMHGASRPGIWFSILGMLVGIFFFPPWGMFLGAIVGAVAGEILAGKGGKEALRAGWGVFLGNIIGVGLKLALSGTMFFFYIKEMF